MKYYKDGFYETKIDDAIEITDEYWQELLNKQSQGGTIQALGENVFCLMSYEKIQNGQIIDISTTAEYSKIQVLKEKEYLKKDLLSKIDEFDKKRIRAICEPEVKNAATGQTWLEYYNLQVNELRNQIAELE